MARRTSRRRAAARGLMTALALATVPAWFMAGGCAPQADWRRAEATPIANAADPGWRAIAPSNARRWSGGITAVASERPGLPNAGSQLPRVAPGGAWVAFLDIDPASPPVSPDQWVTGQRLGGVSLRVRAVEAEGPARNVAPAHAAWPTWSADGSTLLFISHDPDTGCALGLHSVEANRTQRLSVGLRNMLTPAIAPDGRRVAVAGYGEVADQALVFIIDLDTGRATPGPAPTLGGAQLMPRWLDDHTLVFVELDGDGGGLMRWDIGGPRAEPIAPLHLPASIFDAVHLRAGVARPVSPDGRYFTYYAPGRDRLVWVGLDGGERVPLEAGDRAGAWWSDAWFLVADDRQLALVASPQTDGLPAASSDPPRPRMKLLPGRWAPLWADADQRSMLLAGPGDTPDRFRLVQLWVVTR